LRALPLPRSARRRSQRPRTPFYRFHIGDPITFDESPVIDWQAGDTSQISWIGGTPKNWINADYYTES
jgi:hypothetical protein